MPRSFSFLVFVLLPWDYSFAGHCWHDSVRLLVRGVDTVDSVDTVGQCRRRRHR